MTKHLIILIIVFVHTLVFSQKITIHFDSNISTLPSVEKAALKYNKDFAYSFTFDDGTIDALTCGLPVMQGGTVTPISANFSGLFYTDGCGNDIPFRAGIAWNTGNIFGVDVHQGNVSNMLTWRQLDSLYDLGWDVFNHSFSHKSRFFFNMLPQDYINQVEQNALSIKKNTTKKLDTPIFVVPSGDDNYQEVALDLGSRAVFDQTGVTNGMHGLNVSSPLNLTRFKMHRQELTSSLSFYNWLDTVALKSKNNRIWYNEFVHRIDEFMNFGGFNFYVFKNHMQRVADTWGKGGTDRVWMAPLQEVFEYLTFRENIDFAVKTSGNQAEISFNFSKIPSWMRRKALTLVVKSDINFSKIDVPSSVKYTFKGKGDLKLINLEFSDLTTPINELVTEGVAVAYPNPVSDFLNIELKDLSEREYEVSVFDLQGRKQLTTFKTGAKWTLQTASLKSGIYLLQIRNNSTFYKTKFVKN